MPSPPDKEAAETVAEVAEADVDAVPASTAKDSKEDVRYQVLAWIFWILVVFASIRNGWSGVGYVFRYSASLIIAFLIVSAAVAVAKGLMKRWPRLIIVTMVGGFLTMWLYLGSDNFLRDALGMTAGGLAGLMIQQRAWKELRGDGEVRSRWRWIVRLPRRIVELPRRVRVIAIIMAWLGFGAADWVTFRPLPMDMARLEKNTVPNPKLGGVRVGLCLSGGGYRAALMHSGVVAQLEDLGVPIHCVSSVSGGSIFASYYTHGGEPEGFVKAVVDGRFNVKRRLLLPQNMVRLPLPLTMPLTDLPLLGERMGFSRRDVQADLLDLLYLNEEKLRLDEAMLEANDRKGIPRWVIGTTDLMRGWQVGLSAEGFMVCGVRDNAVMRSPDPKKFGDQSPSVAKAVSISGAFPGAFPAAPFQMQTRGLGRRVPKENVKLLLADGGIHDNSGYRLMKAVREKSRVSEVKAVLFGGWDKHWDVDLLLVSNGGQMFDQAEVDGAQDELGRVIGLLSDLPASRQEEEFRVDQDESRPLPDGDTVFLSPGLITGSPDDWLQGLKEKSKARETIGDRVERYFSEKVEPESPWSMVGPLLEALERSDPEVARRREAEDRVKAECRAEIPELLLALHPNQQSVKNVRENLARHEESLPAVAEPTETPAKVERNEIASLPAVAPGQTVSERYKERLAQLVTTDMADCVMAFRSTGTLTDQVTAEVAGKIHRLGRYLAILQWHEMRVRAARQIEERKEREAQREASELSKKKTSEAAALIREKRRLEANKPAAEPSAEEKPKPRPVNGVGQ